MARRISIKEEYLAHCDESTLRTVLEALSREFLLIPLEDYQIEINDMDDAAVRHALDEFRRDIELNRRR